MTFEIEPNIKTIDVQYLVIDSQTPCNMILRRPSLNTLGPIMSTPHFVQNFPVSITKVEVVHADQKEARRCYNKSLRKKQNGARTEGTKEVHMVEIAHSKGMSMRDLDP